MKKSKIIFHRLLSVTFILIAGLIVTSFSADAESVNGVITLKYDDYYSNYESIEIIDYGNPESFKVGYGVTEGTKDDSVVALENGVLHAVGIGTARVIIDSQQYTVKVEPAPLSVFLLLGQSNMYGSEGDENQSIANENGAVYSTVGDSETITLENATYFVPSALTGQGATVNVTGTTKNLEDHPVNRLTESGNGKTGIDSGVAYSWHKLTGDKVWVINAAKGATTIDKWKQGEETYIRVVNLFKAAQQTLRDEIFAGHYILKDYGYFWLQGCTDRANTAEYYAQRLLSLHKDLKNDTAYDIDADGEIETLNFCNIIMVRRGRDDCVTYRNGINSDTTDKSYYESFPDIEMDGPRVAQYYLANNPEYEDINLVCNIGDSWVYMPDGSDAVEEYFSSEYENGRVDYTVQVQQDEQWYTPKTPYDVHDSIHYNQIGYNEVGIEAARNTAYLLSRAEKPDVKTEVTFYDWTGYKEVTGIEALSSAESHTLVVPVVYPVYESKKVTYSLSDNLEYSYYDLTAKYGTTGGTLTSVGADINKTVTINGTPAYDKGEGSYYYTGTPAGLRSTANGIYTENNLVIVEGENGKGKVENGVHKGVIYKLDKNINLLHDKPWLIEWTGKTEGTKKEAHSIILLSENAARKNLSMNEVMYFWHRYYASGNFYITLGKSKQIGNGAATENVAVKLNPYELHTYRLWNEINIDDTNNICLSVDGIFCGRFNSEKGKDFSFRYIGAKTFELNDYSIGYLKVEGNYNCATMGHSCLHSEVKATCTKTGTIISDCIYCDYSKKTITPSLGHKYSSEYISDNNATYLSDGTKSRKCSICSATQTVTDTGSKLKLSRPSKVNVKKDSTTVSLSWSECKDARGYRIYMIVNGKWKALKTFRSTSCTVKNLTEGTKYTFAVRAYTWVGKTCVWAPTYKKVIVTTELETPSVRVASTAKGRATVAWGDVNGETGYQVWYSTKREGKYTKISNYSANTTKIYKTGFTGSRTYYFIVRSYKKTADGYIYSAFSSPRKLTIK